MAIASLNRRPIGRYPAPSTGARPPPPPLPPHWVERERRGELPPLSHFILLSFLLHILAIALVGAPAGGSKEGRAMWGSLLVTLMPARTSAPPAPSPLPPLPGTAAEDALPAPVAFPRLLDRIPSIEPRHEETPPLVVPPPIEAQPAAPTQLAAPPAPSLAPSVALPVPLPTQPAARPADRLLIDPPRVLAAPATPAPVIEVPRMQLAPATPQAERTLLEAPRVLVAPAPVPAPVESVAPPRVAEPSVRPLDTALTREIATPPPGMPARERSPRLDPAARIEPDAPPRPPTAPATSPLRAPAPAATRPADAATYDPTAPSLDPDALRKRAATLSREGSGRRAILAFPMPPMPEKKNKIEDIFDKARKPDCRTAYQQLGLAAIVPLLANEIGEGNCRW
ncbi:MAG: hypothetical protein ABIR98_15360 [Usitatibacter sp.]